MVRNLVDMPALLMSLLVDGETEVVEYKEAKQQFDFEKLGKYFSALSNEANLRNAECGWLIFGVTDKRTICGTAFRKEAKVPSVGLRKLKHEVAGGLNGGMSAGEKRITDFLIKHQSSAVSLSQAELARKCDVSAPTVSRYVKRLGEKDYHARWRLGRR